MRVIFTSKMSIFSDILNNYFDILQNIEKHRIQCALAFSSSHLAAQYIFSKQSFKKVNVYIFTAHNKNFPCTRAQICALKI